MNLDETMEMAELEPAQKSDRLGRYLSAQLQEGEIAHERIYAALKRALMVGEFSPGEKMTVRGLANAFGTSSMPVREALRRLLADEALIQRANRGIIVPPVSLEHLLDLRRIRIAIEGMAAEWAAATITETELKQLTSLQTRLRDMVAVRDSSEYLSCNRDFHFTVYAAARSGGLINLIESLWLQAGPYLTIMRSPATLGLGLDHHDQLIIALENGNGVDARKAISLDIGDAADTLMRAVSAIRPRSAEDPAPQTRNIRARL